MRNPIILMAGRRSRNSARRWAAPTPPSEQGEDAGQVSSWSTGWTVARSRHSRVGRLSSPPPSLPVSFSHSLFLRPPVPARDGEASTRAWTRRSRPARIRCLRPRHPHRGAAERQTCLLMLLIPIGQEPSSSSSRQIPSYHKCLLAWSYRTCRDYNVVNIFQFYFLLLLGCF